MSNGATTTYYSSLKRALCLSYGSHAHVLLLKAYLDDSGKSNDPDGSITCIAGAISPLQAWEELEDEWKQVLSKYEVPYLHMKEYAHSIPGSPFEKWKGREDIRRSFLSSLMDIMGKHILGVFGTTVPNAHFERLSFEQRQRLHDPYFMCFQHTILEAGVNVFAEFNTVGESLNIPSSEIPDGEKLEVIFSRQDEFRTGAETFYETIRNGMTIGPMLGSFTWASYKDVIPLQAADLIAYEVRSFAATLLDSSRSTIRTPMKRLFMMNPFFTFLDYNEMLKRFYVYGPVFRP